MRILVAEDHQTNWMLLERMLRRRGHLADNAADGREALAMFERGQYELVLMDCRMPRLDGYAAAREIRRREAAEPAARVSIVAMSANASESDRRACLAAGMDDYISKPLSFETLDQMLARWLTHQSDASCALDPARLGELRRALSAEEMSGMLRTLAVEVSSEVEQIRTAGPESDPALLAAVAHRIQNSARLIGADQLAARAAALEVRASRNGGASWRPEDDAVLALAHHWGLTRAAIARVLTGPE